MSKGTEGIFYEERAMGGLGAEAQRSRCPQTRPPRPRRAWQPPFWAPCGGNGGLACEALWDPEAAERSSGLSRLTMCCRPAQGRRIAGQSPDVKAL
jgi:hypothetical protein